MSKAETWPEFEQYRVQCNASGTNLEPRIPPKPYRKQLLGTAFAFLAGAASVVVPCFSCFSDPLGCG